jgi:putative glutamine amidotransferase
MKPLIGVTSSSRGGWLMWTFNRFAVWRAGGRALRLRPGPAASVPSLDGLIIGGGDDIDATLYDGEIDPTVRLDRERDAFELALLRRYLPERLPVLGICRGAQMINVALGGSLHEDIHRAFDGVPRLRTPLPRKTIRIRRASRLGALIGRERDRVNALHHQSIETLGTELEVVAEDAYGIVQAIESPNRPFLIGVQWHPEFMVFDRGQVRLFRALVDAARGRRGQQAGRFDRPAIAGRGG